MRTDDTTILIEGDKVYSQRVTKELLNVSNKFIQESINFPVTMHGIVPLTSLIISKGTYFIAREIHEIELKTFFKIIADIKETYITPSYHDGAESAYYEQIYKIPVNVRMYFVSQFDKFDLIPKQYYALWEVDGEYYPAAFPNIYVDGTVCLGATPNVTNCNSYLEAFDLAFDCFINNTWNLDLYADRCKFIKFRENSSGTWNQLHIGTSEFTSVTKIISTDSVRIIGNGLS